jgi:hypothetical protein
MFKNNKVQGGSGLGVSVERGNQALSEKCCAVLLTIVSFHVRSIHYSNHPATERMLLIYYVTRWSSLY